MKKLQPSRFFKPGRHAKFISASPGKHLQKISRGYRVRPGMTSKTNAIHQSRHMESNQCTALSHLGEGEGGDKASASPGKHPSGIIL